MEIQQLKDDKKLIEREITQILMNFKKKYGVNFYVTVRDYEHEVKIDVQVVI